MANTEQFAKILKDSVETWNDWRKKNPDIPIDLDEMNLNEAKLNTVDLSWANLKNAVLRQAFLNEANLSHAVLSGADLRMVNLRNTNLRDANLQDANLHGADLSGAELRGADLSGAELYGAKLHGANLDKANLSRAKLYGAKLDEASLYKADLIVADLGGTGLMGAHLVGADLGGADLHEADLREAEMMGAHLVGANLCGARLEGAILSSANLQYANFDQTTLTGANLWETQRAGWSIKGIICEHAYWDKESEQSTHYSPGEFERLYCDQTRIELFYPGGMTTFELNTLPALLHHLTSKYPNSGIRLKSLEETGGGTKISIAVQDADPETVDKISTLATNSQSAIVDLRDKDIEIARLEGMLVQANRTFDQIFSRTLDAPRVQATNVIMAGDHSTINAHQTYNDTKTLLALLDQITTHRTELSLPKTQETELEEAVQSIQQELAKPHPKPSLISSGLNVIKDIATKVVEGAAEKALTENWHPILSQLNTLMHHWTL